MRVQCNCMREGHTLFFHTLTKSWNIRQCLQERGRLGFFGTVVRMATKCAKRAVFKRDRVTQNNGAMKFTIQPRTKISNSKRIQWAMTWQSNVSFSRTPRNSLCDDTTLVETFVYSKDAHVFLALRFVETIALCVLFHSRVFGSSFFFFCSLQRKNLEENSFVISQPEQDMPHRWSRHQTTFNILNVYDIQKDTFKAKQQTFVIVSHKFCVRIWTCIFVRIHLKNTTWVQKYTKSESITLQQIHQVFSVSLKGWIDFHVIFSPKVKLTTLEHDQSLSNSLYSYLWLWFEHDSNGAQIILLFGIPMFVLKINSLTRSNLSS